MSLKAKLEAVIYAAEEPVTLAQLAALFSIEALEWKAAQEAASAADGAATAESLPILNAELDFAEMEQPSQAESAADSPAPESAPAAVEGETAAGEAATPEGNPETGPEPAAEPAAEAAPADAEAEAKRQARVRDREVRRVLRTLLDELIATYASDDRGIEIKEIAGGFRMATKPECHDAARMFVKSLKPALKLSLPALETLAVIAYKQPITAPEVNEIRGVDSSGVFGSLLARKLIATAGRKQVIGRPILYKTTKEFLLKFGMNDVTELPSMEEFEKMAQLEFEDMEPVEESAAGAGEPGVPETDDDPDAPEEAPLNEPPANPKAEPLEDPKEDPDGDPDKSPIEEPPAAGHASEPEQEGTHQQEQETAATADSTETPASEEPETTEPTAETPATQAATTPAEAAPAPPSNLEHAETETVPHD
jgi:segregation and condensation protein B